MAETLNTFEEPTSTSEETHNAEMLEKADQLERMSNPERPDWLPEKFESPEAMAQAYASLERKLSSGESEEVEDADDSDDDDFDLDEEELELDSQASDVAQALDKAGLDFGAFQSEYLENGELSDTAYQALQESGFNRELVDSWIKGQEALSNQVQANVFNAVGGEQNYREMTAWAAQSLSQNEIDAFNANVDSGDVGLTQFAVQGLFARYRSEAGNEPKLVQGKASTSQGGAFNSVAELTAAMSDPRYHNDPAYRQTVAQKLSRSNVL